MMKHDRQKHKENRRRGLRRHEAVSSPGVLIQGASQLLQKPQLHRRSDVLA